MGFYSVILANTIAIICAFSLNIHYQYRYLQSLIFDSSKQLLSFILSAIALLIIGFFLNKMIKLNLLKLLIIPPAILASCILLYRQFTLITQADINRYFYKENKLKRTLKLFFVKQSSTI